MSFALRMHTVATWVFHALTLRMRLLSVSRISANKRGTCQLCWGLCMFLGEHLRPLTGVLAVVRVCSLSLDRRQRHTNKRVRKQVVCTGVVMCVL